MFLLHLSFLQECIEIIKVSLSMMTIILVALGMVSWFRILLFFDTIMGFLKKGEIKIDIIGEEYREFIYNSFQKRELEKPLFYHSSVAIRFELGESSMNTDELLYMNQVYKRSQVLFKEIFLPDDQLYVVWYSECTPGRKWEPTGVLKKYLKVKSLKNRLSAEKVLRDGVYFFKFVLRCSVKDIRITVMLVAIANQDMNIAPKLEYECYFLNIEKKIIYHMYDDRGLDIVANSAEILKPIYHKYNDWALSYDRNEIEDKLGL